MAYSKIQIPGNGTNGPFVVAFALGYLSQSEVTCRVNQEVDGLGAPVYRTITWLDVELVNISGAAPSALDTITFERTLDKTTLKHDFSDGAPIIERNLDESHKQAIMLVHEALDGRFGALQGDLDVGNHYVINVLDPVNAQDAATKAYVDLQVFASGGVVAPTAPDIGKVLTATGVGTYGWGNPASVPNATETVAGIAEIATDAEVTTGTDNTNKFLNVLKAVTAFGRKAFANTWTAAQTFVTAAAGGEPARVESTDNGTTLYSPRVSFYRNKATPSAGPDGAMISITKDSVGTAYDSAYIGFRSGSVTAGAQTSIIDFLTRVAGVLAERFKIGGGLYAPSATGGDKGNGTVNALAVYANGQPLGGGIGVYNYEVAAGTNAAATVADTWTTGILNTQLLNNLGAGNGALASNQVTLLAGTYRVRGFKTFYASNYSTWRLQNITDGATIVRAGHVDMGVSGLSVPAILSQYEFTIAGTKVVAMQYYADGAHANGQGGTATGNPAGVNQVMAQIVFEKVA